MIYTKNVPYIFYSNMFQFKDEFRTKQVLQTIFISRPLKKGQMPLCQPFPLWSLFLGSKQPPLPRPAQLLHHVQQQHQLTALSVQQQLYLQPLAQV